MLLDAEMHNVSQIQSELIELFQKHGIRNFSFKQANSIRVGFEADAGAMRIYEALVKAGFIKSFAGFNVMTFSIRNEAPQDPSLADLLARIERLRGTSIEHILQTIRMEGWREQFPDHTAVIVDALRYQQEQSKRAPQRKGRILYPKGEGKSGARPGEIVLPKLALPDSQALREETRPVDTPYRPQRSSDLVCRRLPARQRYRRRGAAGLFEAEAVLHMAKPAGRLRRF